MGKRGKIWVVQDDFGRPGGAGTVNYILAREFRRQGFTVNLVSYHPVGEHLWEENQPFTRSLRIPGEQYSFNNPLVARRAMRAPERVARRVYTSVWNSVQDRVVSRLVKEFSEEDVLLFARPELCERVMRVRSKRQPFPRTVIAHLHSSSRGLEATGYLERWRKLSPFITDFVTLDPHDAADFSEALGRSVHAIPNPAPLPPLSAEELPNERPHTIVYAGRFSPEKQIDVIIRAFDEAKRRAGGDWALELHGSGEPGIEAQIREVAQSITAAHAVTVHGPYTDAGAVFQRAGVAVLHSEFEGAPVVFSEAAACGVPYITAPSSAYCESFARRCGWLTDVVGREGMESPTSGEYRFADLVSALEQLMRNPSLIDARSADALEACRELQPDVIIEKWMPIVEGRAVPAA